jgi:hypothetical protein
MWVRDPGSGKNPSPDPGVKKAPDPGSGTLVRVMLYLAPGAPTAGVHTRHAELVGRPRL